TIRTRSRSTSPGRTWCASVGCGWTRTTRTCSTSGSWGTTSGRARPRTRCRSPRPSSMGRAPDGRDRGRTGGALRARREVSAGGVVFRRDGELRILLIRDPYDNWGLPKGHIEAGETAQETAEREVREETGLTDLRSIAELPTIDWYFRDRGELVH